MLSPQVHGLHKTISHKHIDAFQKLKLPETKTRTKMNKNYSFTSHLPVCQLFTLLQPRAVDLVMMGRPRPCHQGCPTIRRRYYTIFTRHHDWPLRSVPLRFHIYLTLVANCEASNLGSTLIVSRVKEFLLPNYYSSLCYLCA